MAGKELVSYYDFAENDYAFLQATYESGYVANTMAAIAQGICEKYLKSVIEDGTDQTKQQYQSVMKTHSIRKLIRYIEGELPEFECEEGTIKKVDGYYFSTRYPGDESITINQKDLDECMEAVEACREAVVRYFKQKEIEQTKGNRNRTR